MSLLDTFAYNKLEGGSNVLKVTKPVTILSGTAALLKGTVLGLITVGAISETHAGNTGDGAMTLSVAGTKTQVGVYTVEFFKAVTNLGDFDVKAPDGSLVGIGKVGVAFVSNHINFTIADGTDFIFGDKFLVTVAAGSGKAVGVDSALVNGANNPVGVLLEDADATSADKVTTMAVTGQFDENGLIFVGSGNTIATFRAALEAKQIHAKAGIAA